MTRRLLGSYLTITAFVLLILEIPLGITFQRSEKAQLVANLESNARILGSFSEQTLNSWDGHDNVPSATLVKFRGDLTREVVSVARRQNVGVLVVDNLGRRVVWSSAAEAEAPDLANQPEIAKALALGPHSTPRVWQTASVQRYSAAVKQTILFVTVPVVSGQILLGGVRLG
ncbi:MAG TPA: hypothetical protein VGI86_18085, partial [Acidimicrobiia bacterium]